MIASTKLWLCEVYGVGRCPVDETEAGACPHHGYHHYHTTCDADKAVCIFLGQEKISVKCYEEELTLDKILGVTR